jgi:hypothetical protein
MMQNRWSDKSVPQQTETKTIYDHQATTTKVSSRNSAQKNESKQNHERTGSTKPQEKKRQGIRE